MRDAEWMSVTSAGQLLRCPASAAFTYSPTVPPPSAPQNVGSLAHFAMGAWIESDGWLADNPGASLQAAWDAEAERWGTDPKRLNDSVMTRSRLRRRGAELARLLIGSGVAAFSEVVLHDDLRRLYGQLDVVVDGADGSGAVVDLKTGHNNTSNIGAEVRTQLLLYAHLFATQYGHLPASLVAFSLRYGAVRVAFSQHDIDALLRSIERARGAQPRLAVPDETGCRYCRRRLVCEPHWDVAKTWEDPDCIEGHVVKTESSQAGSTAIRVATARGDEWVTGLTGLDHGALASGRSLRVTEIAGRRVKDEREWRAGRFTRAQIIPD